MYAITVDLALGRGSMGLTTRLKSRSDSGRENKWSKTF